MKVRTKIAALIYGGVIAAVLSLITVGDGRPVADPSARTSATASLGLASSRHATGTIPAPPPSSASPIPAPTLDGLVLEGLRGALTYLAIFAPLHYALRRFCVVSRWAYAGIGSVAMLISLSSQITLSSWAILEREGHVSGVVFLGLLIGAVVGFIYNWRAGLEAEGDDPERLGKALASHKLRSGDDPTSSRASQIDESHISVGREEYFSGPLQVRTSAPVAFVAALVSAGFYGLVHVSFGVAGEMSLHLKDHVHPLGEALGYSIQSQLFTLVLMGLFAPLPFTAVVLLAHLILRAFDKTSYRSYLFAGALSPLLLCLVLGPLMLVFGLQAVVPLAMAATLYRNMAGLQPKRVKEDIHLTDRRDLVGANHPRRTFGRLVKT